MLSLRTFLQCLRPSTRKERAKERPSRLLEIMSDVENVDIMLGSYSRDDEENDQSESEVNSDLLGSIRLQRNSNAVGKDFTSLLTNSRENSEITIKTTKMISEEITNQVSRRLNEIEDSLNFQVQDAINKAKTEKVLLLIQITLDTHVGANFTVVDRGSHGLQESPRQLISPWWTGVPQATKNPMATNFTLVDRDPTGYKRAQGQLISP